MLCEAGHRHRGRSGARPSTDASCAYRRSASRRDGVGLSSGTTEHSRIGKFPRGRVDDLSKTSEPILCMIYGFAMRSAHTLKRM